MTRAEIAEIETADLRRRYARKQAPRVNRNKLTKALTIYGAIVERMDREAVAKEGRGGCCKAIAKVERAKVKARKDQEKAQKGQKGTQAMTACAGKGKGKKQVTIVIEDEEVEDQGWNHRLDNYVPPIFTVGLRSRKGRSLKADGDGSGEKD
ncbi:hypothetical protein BDD12DRAFT_830087 [Trichophaea hybrida]|nr:hypothetical protein BDD12DRAFT_830087 [Trichophaea hybrida]